MSTKVKPAAKIRMSNVTAAIWEKKQNDGRIAYSVSFQRSFTDEHGNWKNSDSFFPNDLLLVAKLANEAHSAIHRMRDANRETPSDEDAQASDQ